ncbi:MAG: type 1 periplasmic binding fold superfamily protein [Cytophagales bacterium]|nr:MAG: type 1 periplasmic binding fold superfamily protein [Cytophagales bacterium]
MKTKILSMLVAMSMVAVLFSCSKKEESPADGNESELITTVRLRFSEGGTSQTFTYRDLDGAGGNAPVIDAIRLANGKNYSLELEVLDESNPSKIGNITEEIFEEGYEHQFFFTGTAAANLLSLSYADKDKNNNPIGLKNSVMTKATGNGILTVILRHKPNKAGAGVANGQVANAGGETDIEVNFNVTVQ